MPAFDTFAERNVAFYFLPLTMMVLCFAALWRLVNSLRIGLLLAALRQNEDLASSMGAQRAGAPRTRHAISSFLGGVGGAIFVAIVSRSIRQSFTVNDSANFMLNCFLGGLGYVFVSGCSGRSYSISAGTCCSRRRNISS